ncbi:hypothetical protein Mal4_40560 [Maioricimonas rarisocia]|uniref:Uncharacterized protein n=1 Tax=Maioricimonas rarisocia TaxID=2528026 RepID=A0A517ZBA2_9PLAN|nr:hypothetical protein [Maioricimonas rarisocia]QDU39710.1 hypothetical protein Mal4_40560 [Maioricimonas rarisocia]
MITIERKIHLRPTKHGRKQIRKEPSPLEDVKPGRVPRVARLMALAIRFERLLHEGVVADQPALARLAHVSQPRITQIMNLLHLAPDIQEELLLLPRVRSGRDPIHEKMLRPVAAEVDWGRQRELWRAIVRERVVTQPSECNPAAEATDSGVEAGETRDAGESGDRLLATTPQRR